MLAILFRPLALLPFPVAAAIWQAVITGSLVLTIRRIGVREPVLIAMGCLALPLFWALSIGQAELLVLLMVTLGTPASVAFAGGLKVFPVLVAVYWIGRRDWQALARLALWILESDCSSSSSRRRPRSPICGSGGSRAHSISGSSRRSRSTRCCGW